MFFRYIFLIHCVSERLYNVSDFSLKRCKYDAVYLMRRKSQAKESYMNYIRDVGAPIAMINDNAKEMVGDEWNSISETQFDLRGQI